MQNSQGNTCARVSFFSFLCLPVSFAKFLRTPFLQNTARRLLQHTRNRSRRSNRRCSINKAVLKNVAICTRKHLWWSLFLINFIIKRLQHRYFLENIVKLLRTPIVKSICERLRVRVGKVGYTTKVRRSHVIGRYSGKLLFENRDLNISLNFSTLLVKLQLWIGKWNKGFELFKLTFLNLFFSFPEKKWDHSKLKTANFPVVIFCKDKDRAYLTGACISKSLLPHSTGNMTVA